MAYLPQEEADATTRWWWQKGDDPSCPLQLNVALTRRGRSRPRKRKNKEWHRMWGGALVLGTDFFGEHPTHMAREFWRWFMMNKEFFMRIVCRVREHDDYISYARRITLDWLVSHRFRKTLLCWGVLLMELLPIHKLTIFTCLRLNALKVCTYFVGLSLHCLDRFIREHLMKKTQLRSWPKTVREDS
jgi:hypothetical protein